MRPQEADIWLLRVYTVTLCRRCFVIDLENQMIMRVNGTEGYTVRALTGNYKWRTNSLNQNAAVWVEAMVHMASSPPADTTHLRSWVSACVGQSRLRGRRVCPRGHVWVKRGWRRWRSTFPPQHCPVAVLAAALPTWQSLGAG